MHNHICNIHVIINIKVFAHSYILYASLLLTLMFLIGFICKLVRFVLGAGIFFFHFLLWGLISVYSEFLHILKYLIFTPKDK